MADLVKDEFVLNFTGDSRQTKSEQNSDEVLSALLEDSRPIKQYYQKQRKFSDAEIQEMKDGIREICVNDFDDDYNLTDEEKYANEEEARIFSAVLRTKRKCNNITDFIVAIRNRLSAIDYIAEHNGVYEPEEFLELVSKGKIVLTGLTIPKYTGKNRKKINWDYIMEFAADRTKNPREFRTEEHDDDFYDHVKEDNGRNIFSETEYHNIIESCDPDESVSVEMTVTSDKMMKKLTKRNPNIADSIVKYVAELKRSIERSYSFEVSDAMHELRSIEVLDKRNIRASKVAPPQFTGDFESAKDWQEYEREYYQWYINNVYVDDSLGSRTTISEHDQAESRKIMEEAGWNVRKFSSNAAYFKSQKKKAKKEKRKEARKKKRVKDNLLESNARNQNGKKKKGKKKESSEKLIDDMKKRQSRDLLELTGGNYADFEDYVNDMEHVDYGKIMGRKGK